jgi:hypothetical protein
MYDKISVLIPTRRRLVRLQTLLDSLAHTPPESVELVFRVDSDDRETVNYLSEHCDRCVVMIGPRYDGYRSMPIFYNEMAALATGDVLLCGNDDMIFRTDCWARLVLEAANCYPDGVFNIGVSTYNEAHYPFSIVSRKATERMGFLWDPRIFWGDIFLRDVMAWFDRCVMVPSVHIDHDWAGYDPDQVFQETRVSKSQIEGDQAYWTTVHRPAVEEAAGKLQRLMYGS